MTGYLGLGCIHRAFPSDRVYALVAYLSILMIAGAVIDWAVPGTSQQEKITFEIVLAILAAFIGILFVYLDTFKKTLWELIAIPSPLYGALVFFVVAGYYAGKALSLT